MDEFYITEEDFNKMEQAERDKHDEKARELEDKNKCWCCSDKDECTAFLPLGYCYKGME